MERPGPCSNAHLSTLAPKAFRVLKGKVLRFLIGCFLFFFSSYSSAFGQDQIQGVAAQDYHALVDLYNSTSGAGWINKSGWLDSSVPVSNWYGVIVYNGRVVKLRLQSNNLVGSLPESLGNLTALVHVGLYSNSLSGSIPESIGNLIKLQTLYLYDNQLSGSIPVGIGNLVDLTHLYLYNNQLTGSIPESIGNLTKLQILYLHYNQLTGSIPASIGNLSSLTRLYLMRNQLSGSLPASLGNLTSLTHLYIPSNQFSGSIPSSIGNLTQLIYLVLYNNQLEGQIPASIGQLSNLQYLRLGNNKLSGELPASLGQLSNLKQMELFANNLSGELPQELGNLTKLENFAVTANDFSGSVPEGMAALPNLRVFDVSNNEITGLPSTPFVSTVMVEFDVSNNQLTFEDLEPHKAQLGSNFVTEKKITNDTTIHVPENTLYQIISESRAENNYYKWYKNWVLKSEGLKLDTFKIENFTLADTGKYQYVITNSGFPGVTLYSGFYHLKEGAYQGLVPDAVEYSALKALYDSTNGDGWTTKTNWLQGTTSADFATWHGIEVRDGDVYSISLWSNYLSGKVPEEMGQLKNLVYLFISNNQLTSLPGSIGNLSSLSALGLSNNQLTTLPESIGNLSNLYGLYLSNNQLTTLPESIGNLSGLTEFFCDHNQLTSLPESIGNLNNYISLDFSYNQLSSLPESLENLIMALYIEENFLPFEEFESIYYRLTNTYGSDVVICKPQKEKPQQELLVTNQKILLESQDNALHNFFQWQKQENGSWTDIAGATASTYSATLTEGETEAFYRCQITNEWVTDLTLFSPVYHLIHYENENVAGNTPGNLSSKYCAIGKLYSPIGGVASGENYPAEGGAGLNGIEIDEKNNKVYAVAGAGGNNSLWILDRNTNQGSVLNKTSVVVGDPLPDNLLSLFLDEEKQILYAGTWGHGLWIYDIQNNTGKLYNTNKQPPVNGDLFPGNVIFEIRKVRDKIFLSFHGGSQGGIYMLDETLENGKLLSTSTTAAGKKYEVIGDPMPGGNCSTFDYAVRNGKEYLYVGIEYHGLWEYNLTDNVGRNLTPQNTVPGGSQEVIGDPLSDHELYGIHIVGNKLVATLWSVNDVWIYNLDTNESVILSHESTKPGGKHEVIGDPIPDKVDLRSGTLEFDYQRNTLYAAMGTVADMPDEERGGVWEYELSTNKARFYGLVDEGENFKYGIFSPLKKDEGSNILYGTTWPAVANAALFELSYSTTPCNVVVPPLTSLSDNPPTDAPAPTVTGTLNAPAEVAAVSDINYVRTFTPRNPVTSDADFSLSSPAADLQVVTQYIDGLGRPVQTVMRGESPEGKDIIQPIVYDAFGRVEKEYLPYTHNSSDPGKYQSNALKQQYDFYHAAGDEIADTDFPFAQKVFEPSPLNRVVAQASPGESWAVGSGHEVGFNWRGNTIALDGEIRLWNIDEINLFPANSAIYAPNELWVTETTDEDEKKVWEYKNKLGQVVLKKVQLADAPDPATIAHYTYTYYVYDDLQNLRFVIQPEGLKKIAEANWLVSAELKKQFCFSYKYDARKRMIEKQVPGAEPVHMVYNQRDLLVLSQDGNQRANGEWSFTKYDELNRPILSGILTDSRSRGEMETAARADSIMVEKRETGTTHMGYSNDAFPKLTLGTNTYYLTASYYDAYDFDFNGTADLEYTTSGLSPEPVAFGSNKGRLTGTKVRVLGTDTWLTTATFYDNQGRVIQTQGDNHLGGKDVLTTRYKNAVNSRLEATRLVHTATNQPQTTIDRNFVYDHADRLLTMTHQINGGEVVTLLANEYNELGELTTKQLHKGAGEADFRQAVDYRYNVRGWLEGINNAEATTFDAKRLFAMNLYYDYGFQELNHNGNISGVKWKNPLSKETKAYGYLYDNLNRIKGADYRAGIAGAWTKEVDRYDIDWQYWL